jgi:hypothetical protein
MATDYDDICNPDPQRIEREIHAEVKHCRFVVLQYRRQLLELTSGGRPAVPLNRS